MWKPVMVIDGNNKLWMVEKIINDCVTHTYSEGDRQYETPYQSEAQELANKLNGDSGE